MTTTAQDTEQRTIEITEVRSEGKTLVGYAARYGVESRDLGGFVEQIDPHAFDEVLAGDPDVHLLLNHNPDAVLARTMSGTLRLSSDAHGLAFSADLGDSPLAENVRESVKRKDIDGASFRFRVAEGGERWDGNKRTLVRVAELYDVTVATRGAYPQATVELRTHPEAKEAPMSETTAPEATTTNGTAAPQAPAPTEAPPAPPPPPAATEERTTGSLRVSERTAGEPESRTLYGAYKHAGWEPGTRTAISWTEFSESSEQRALTWTGSVDLVNRLDRASGPFGFDQRYAWPAFPSVPVDSGVTSVAVMGQTARTLPSAATVVRAIDAVTAKPESASTLTVTSVPMKQVAAVVSNIPNVMMEQPTIEQVLGADLRLSINEGLDKIVIDTFAASDFQAPGTDNILVSIRKAMSTIMTSGYSPDTVIVTPAIAEAIDVMVSGISGGTADFVFGAGQFAPGTLFGLTKRISKTVAAPVVVDAQAFGRLYSSPISLASFEMADGSTNTTLLRLEGHAAFGVERQTAAIRIAAA